MCFPPHVAESTEEAHPARSGQSTERCGDEKEDAAALGPTERVLQGHRMALWMRPREEQYLHGGACTEVKNYSTEQQDCAPGAGKRATGSETWKSKREADTVRWF
ncbi:hypothetical protein ERJ75_001546900 [Trypanosoma vivax]|nr:hypothetical protein ERJ75_001546900 [Trypanosoma vivax]